MSPAHAVSTNSSTASARMSATVVPFAAHRTTGKRSSSTRGYRASTGRSATKTAITTNVSAIVAPAPVSHSQSGSGRSKRWPNPCASTGDVAIALIAASRKRATRGMRRGNGQFNGNNLWMHFQVEDRVVTSATVRFHRKSSWNARLERHRRGRGGRDPDLDVVAVQVQLHRLVARPPELDIVALLHLDRVVAAERAVDDRQREDLAPRSVGSEAGRRDRREHRDRRDAKEIAPGAERVFVTRLALAARGNGAG